MKRSTSTVAGSALVLAVLAAFSGAAYAGGGNPHGSGGTAPGNSANAPGQQKQQAAPAAPATQPGHSASAPGQQKRQQAGSTASPGNSANAPGRQKKQSGGSGGGSNAAKPSHAGKGSQKSQTTSSTAFANPSGKPRRNVPSGAVTGYQQHPESFGGPGNSGTHKYTVCHNGHAITVDVHSWRAHVEKHGDPLLPYGTKGKQACETAGTQPTATPTPTSEQPPTCPTTAVTTVLGILHATGSVTNPFVLIHPNGNSAHSKGKHEDDLVLTQTVEVPTAGCTNTPTSTATGGAPNVTGSAGANVGAAGAPQGGTATSGGVKGASAGATKGERARGAGATRPTRRGVLGASKNAGRAVGATVTRGQLPFTGFPVWATLLIGLALIGGGLALRRVRSTA